MMNTIDVVKLALAGKSADEIRELAAIQSELDAKEKEPAPAPAPAPAVDPEPEHKEKETAKHENQENDPKQEELQKELEETKAKLEAAQKANMNKDVSGRSADEPTDQDRFDSVVAAYMT